MTRKSKAAQIEMCEILIAFHTKFAREGGHEAAYYKQELRKLKEATEK